MRRALIFTTLFFSVLAAAIGVGGFLWFKQAYFGPGPSATDRILVIERGTSVMSIATALEREGVVRDALVFQYGSRFFSTGKPLRAGEFKFPAHASAAAVVDILQNADPVVHRVTIAEGLSSIQIVDLLRDEPALEGDIDNIPAEGTLLPETYHFYRGETRISMLQRAERAMSETLQKLWIGRANDLPISTPREAVILASIVEKETSLADERPLVGSVFVNRLRIGMRLQSDPTVVYGITNGAGSLGRPLTRDDLEAPTPYNTYQIKGLPPGPIANPGRASIAAVLNPAVSKYLYFVADGSGGHAFSETLDEHNQNVRQWRKLQRNR